MALDANGVPIPVFVPPPGPPRGQTPVSDPAPDPDIENDVGILKGEMLALQDRVRTLLLVDFEVGKLTRRLAALEEFEDAVRRMQLRQEQMEVSLGKIPMLLDRVAQVELTMLETARISPLEERIERLEQQVFELQNVDPV